VIAHLSLMAAVGAVALVKNALGARSLLRRTVPGRGAWIADRRKPEILMDGDTTILTTAALQEMGTAHGVYESPRLNGSVPGGHPAQAAR